MTTTAKTNVSLRGTLIYRNATCYLFSCASMSYVYVFLNVSKFLTWLPLASNKKIKGAMFILFSVSRLNP